MSLDYCLACKDCNDKIWFNLGLGTLILRIFDYENDESRNRAENQLKTVVEFLEKHQHTSYDSHRIIYTDEHNYIQIESDDYYQKAREQSTCATHTPSDQEEISEIISRFVPINDCSSDLLYKIGICPFHEDDFGTLIIDTPNQRFHCTECYANGNVWGFLKLLSEGKKVELYKPYHLSQQPMEGSENV